MKSKIRKAVIVAAGRSSRLYPLTETTPKGLLDLGGQSLLGRSVEALKVSGVREIAMVVGFEKEKLIDTFDGKGVRFIYNPFYADTNNLGSLWFAKNWVGDEPFIYLHSDLAYDPLLLNVLIETPPPDCSASLLVQMGPVDSEAMKVELDRSGRFMRSSKEIEPGQACGEWVGMAVFSAGVVPGLFAALEEVIEDRLIQAYDTEAFTRMARKGVDFKIVATQNRQWVEIDFIEDLERARKLFGARESCEVRA